MTAINRAAARCALSAILGVTLAACAPSAPSGPSLVMICIDTVRADVFNLPGLEDELTPWIEQAQRYHNARSTAPWTMPAVSSIFTGLYPAQHDAGRFQGPVANLGAEKPTALSEAHQTIAETLFEHDFKTRAFVAHPWFKSEFGLNQGFEALEFNPGMTQIFEQAVDWFTDLSKSKRFFAYLHIMEAHDRHRTGREQIEQRFAALDPSRRQYLIDHANAASCQRLDSIRCLKTQAYMLSVLEIRQALAALMADLAASGRMDDTIVLLWSDHGEEFREHAAQHREMQTDPRDIYGLGHGQSLFDVLLRIPLLAWVPGQPGAVHHDLASLVDVYPSLLSWLGIDYRDEQWPGVVLPAGKAGAAADASRVIYASNVAFGPETIAVINNRFKAMYWPADDRFRFFDHINDPGETAAVVTDPLVLEFSSLAGDYLDIQALHQGAVPDLEAEQLQALKSIGYLQGVEDE